MSSFIGWIPNTLGKISFSISRQKDTFKLDSDDLKSPEWNADKKIIVVGLDKFTTDVLFAPPFLPHSFEKLLNFAFYIFQKPLFFLFKLFKKNSIFGIEIERELFTKGIIRFIAKSKVGYHSDTRFIFVGQGKENSEDHKFFEELHGRVYAFPLNTFLLWRRGPGELSSNKLNDKLFDIIQKGEVPDRRLDELLKLDISTTENYNFFYADVIVHRSGLCRFSDLAYLKKQESNNTDDSLETLTDTRAYQQLYYFLKDCFHKHKHHTANFDTLTSAFPIDELKIQEEEKVFESLWMQKIVYGMTRYSIRYKNEAFYCRAKGVANYVSAFKNVAERVVNNNYPKWSELNLPARTEPENSLKMSPSIHGNLEDYFESLSSLKDEQDAEKLKGFRIKAAVLSTTIIAIGITYKFLSKESRESFDALLKSGIADIENLGLNILHISGILFLLIYIIIDGYLSHKIKDAYVIRELNNSTAFKLLFTKHRGLGSKFRFAFDLVYSWLRPLKHLFFKLIKASYEVGVYLKKIKNYPC